MPMFRFLIASVLILSLTACSDSGTAAGDSRPVLLASVGAQSEIISFIAGDGFQVITLLDKGSDPETFDPSPDIIRRASTAKIYFATGVLPFEERIVASLPDNVPVLNAADSISIIYGTHGDDIGADPHIWASAKNLKTMAGIILSGLSALNPDSVGVYSTRYQTVESVLDSVDASIESRLSHAYHSFGVWHPSLSYFARDYGIRQYALGTAHREASPRQLRQAIDTLRNAGVKVVFYENEGERARVEAICESAGARAVGLRMLDNGWINRLSEIADEIARP